MKYGPITQRKMLNQLLHLRSVEKLSGPQIAKRLNTTYGWVAYQLRKFDLSAKLSTVASRENMARAAELREQGVCWKRIAQELGVERWQSLARAHYVANR